MARIRVPQNSFQFGEISPSLTSRTDTPVYNNSAERVRNFFIKGEGGVTKRPGTKRWANFGSTPSYDSSLRQTVRIEPFIFSDDEKYIIAFSHERIEIFQISPTTGNVSSIQSLTSQTWLQNTSSAPYLEEITFTQQGDIMFIAHNTFMIRKLTRTSLTTFAISTFNFDTSTNNNEIFQPYFSFQEQGVTITPSATSGSGVTLTTSADYFNTDSPSKHIGIDLLIGETRVRITGVTNATTATGDVKGRIRTQLDTDAFQTFEGSNRVQVTHALHGLSASTSVTISRAGAVGGIAIGNLNGARTISTVINENVYEITAGASATASAIGGGRPRVETAGATTEFAEQSYSALRGYPAAVTFHQNRLWFGGTLAQPDGIWGSKTGQFFNFDIGDAEDNDALDLTANVGEIFSIRHLVSNRDLQIFTTGAELFVQAPTDKPVTPANATIRRQTPFGSSFVKPTVFDGATLFIQKTGSAMREFLFTDTESAYTSVAVSSLAPHLILDPVQQTSIKGALNRSEAYAFLLNNDGTIAVFYSIRGDRKSGWSLWDTSGKWHSICSVHERLFVVASRDDGSGSDKLFLEEFQTDMPMDFCDSFSGTASVFSSLTSHFSNNAVVKAVTGNNFLGQFTISGGQIDASETQTGVTQAFIGYAFTPEIKTLPVDAQVVGGPLTGEPRKITRVTLDLVSTLAVSVNATDLIIRNVTDDMSQERSAVTGKEEFYLIGYDRDPRVTVSQSFPFDLQVNGMVMEVAF